MEIILILLILPSFMLAFGVIVLYATTKICKYCETLQNRNHFYIARDKYDARLWLYLRKPVRDTDSWIPCDIGKALYPECEFKNLGLNKDDFENLKWEDEPVEVFFNLED